MGTQLSKEDKETLNLVIPWDLTPDEIEAMKAQLTTASGQPQDLVTSVIAAIQQVRPLGQQRLGPSKTVVAANEDRPTTQEPARTNRDDAAVATNDDRSPTNQESARANREDKTSKPPTKAPSAKKAEKTANKPSGTWIVDPTETLLRVITADEHGNVTVPRVVRFPGFDAEVTRSGVARYSFGTGEQGSETSYMVTVTIRPMDPPLGLHLSDGRAITGGNDLKNVLVIVHAARSSS